MELLIVGLDGLSYNMLEDLDVSAPFIEETSTRGVSGGLQSVDPPTTLPAWTSFATGKDPGSHGISTMLQQGPEYDVTPARPNEDDATVYDLLDDAVLINLPASVSRTPTGEDVELVSSFLATDASEAIPPSLSDLGAASEYVVKADTSLQSTPDAYMEQLHETTDARVAFAEQAFDRCDPRVGFVLFSTPDWVGHFLQHAPDERTAGEWYRAVVERVDEYAARLAQRADNVVLVSDHGFERKDRALHLKTWLANREYLQTRDEERSLSQRLATGIASTLARTFRPGYELARSVYLSLDDASDGAAVGSLVDMNPDVDFETATAWQLRYGCLYVNDDRFATPTVEDPERARRALRDELRGVEADGRPVFTDVHFAEDVYEDPNEYAPDVIARPAEGVLPLRATSPTGSFVRPTPSDTFFDHRREGLIAARGPLFAESATVDGASIVDVFPTVLHALGEPIVPDFDGEVRSEMLTTDASPVVRDDGAVPEPAVQGQRGADVDTVRERLADLGYLE